MIKTVKTKRHYSALLAIKRTFQATFFFMILMVFCLACKETAFTPKPMGYHRIDFPEKTYQAFDYPDCPFTFEYPTYANITKKVTYPAEPCWMDLLVPGYHAVVHLSYKAIVNQESLVDYIDDSHTMAYKHTVKAESIQEIRYDNSENGVHGILYRLGGNTASAIQFFITDSTQHFLRGSLYIETEPNRDSLAPVIDFLKQDIMHLIETITWN